MSGVLLELRDVCVERAGRTLLSVDALAVRRGETLTLIGSNGAGKSTLLQVLGLLTPLERGELRIDGAPVSPRSRRLLALRRRIAGVLQEPLLFRMSVARNVALGLRFRGLPRQEIERRTSLWLERLGIAPLRDRPAGQLSGGEARRTSLARALVLEPELLLLDEPFAALDTPTREALLVELRTILAETRTTTVFATHERSEALALGDRVAVLAAGRIVQQGPPEEVFSQPCSEEVAHLVGAQTLIRGRATWARDGLVGVEAGSATLEVGGQCAPGDDVLVCLRAEDLTLLAGDDRAQRSARNTLEGRIVGIVPEASHVRVSVDCGVRVTALVTRSSLQEMALAPGGQVRVAFKATAAHLIVRPGVARSGATR